MRFAMLSLVLTACAGHSTHGTSGDSTGACGSATSCATNVLYDGSPSWLSQDASALYFLDSASPYTIVTLAKTGGVPTVLVSNQAPIAGTMYDKLAAPATHAGYVYFCGEGASSSDLLRVPTSGGAVQRVFALTGVSLSTTCTSVAANDTTAFVEIGSATAGQLYGGPVDGSGPAIQIASTAGPPILADASGVYYISTMDSQTYDFFRAVPGGMPTQIFGPFVNGLAVSGALSGDHLAYVEPSFDSVRVLSISTGQLALDQHSPLAWAIAIDASELYWAEAPSDGAGRVPKQPPSIWREALSGGSPCEVCQPANLASSFVLDTQALYFIDLETISTARIESLPR